MNRQMYRVQATNRRGIVLHLSFCEATSEQEAIQRTKTYQATGIKRSAKWRAEPATESEQAL